MYFMLCIVCCVVYCLLYITVLCCSNNQMQKMFQRKLHNVFVFIVCCVVYCLLCIIVLFCANNQMQIFSPKFIFFHKNILCKIIKGFFECCMFLNICMQCSVDVTESVVERLLRVWCRYAVIPLAGLTVVPLAVGAHGHVIQPIIKTLFNNPFSHFCCKKSAISRL